MNWIVPVALFLAAHTGTLIWFLASTNTSLRFLGQQVGELKGELAKLRENDARVGVLENQVLELSRRLSDLEASAA